MIDFSQHLNYLDPGTGSYIFQAIIAAGVTVGVYFKQIKVFVVNLISKFKNKSN